MERRIAAGMILICGASLFAPSMLAAATKQQLQSKIKTTRATIKSANSRLNALNKQLEQQEQRLASVHNKIKTTQAQLLDKQKNISALQVKITAKEKILQQQRQNLAHELGVSYKLISQPVIKRMFADPQQQQRLLYYYKVIVKVQTKQMQELQSTMRDLAATQAQLRADKQQLQANKAHLTAAVREQKLTLRKRSSTVRQLQASLQKSTARLQHLLAEQRALDAAVSKVSKYVSASGSFKKQRGHLQWPVYGRIGHSFGSQMSETALRYKGVVIDAASGKPVHVVASGKVIFAQWLAGYGQLIIVDHGNGYMSLYGRNQNLNVQLGDKVQAGQTIAWVGMSGGFTQPALYFALRKNGKPLNPKKWLTRA